MKRKYLPILVLAGCICFDAPSLFAQQGMGNEALLKRIEQLQQLKETNPEAYQKVIQNKRSKLKQNFDKLQKGDRQKLKRFMNQDQQAKRKRIAYLKENHPEKFNRLKEARLKRLEKRAQRNPEKFQKFLQKNPNARKRFQKHIKNQGNQEGPGQRSNFKNFVQNNPQIKKRMDQNQDGTIDQAERSRAKEIWQERRQNQSERSQVNRPWERKADQNQDGFVNPKEAQRFKQKAQGFQQRRLNQDRDNNPPGKRGGPGTNWENRPGPQGGPGSSPNRQGFQKRNQNNQSGNKRIGNQIARKNQVQRSGQRNITQNRMKNQGARPGSKKQGGPARKR